MFSACMKQNKLLTGLSLRCALKSVVVEQLLDKIHVCHEHAAAAVAREPQSVQRSPAERGVEYRVM